MEKFLLRAAIGFVFLCCFAGFIIAQQGSSIRGQITDEFGGALVGAAVKLVDQTGAQVDVSKTNDEGIYIFNNIKPGKYTVRAAAEGFADFEKTSVDVLENRRAQVN